MFGSSAVYRVVAGRRFERRLRRVPPADFAQAIFVDPVTKKDELSLAYKAKIPAAPSLTPKNYAAHNYYADLTRDICYGPFDNQVPLVGFY